MLVSLSLAYKDPPKKKENNREREKERIKKYKIEKRKSNKKGRRYTPSET